MTTTPPGHPPDQACLLDLARKAAASAHVPYSHFPVGAAILTHSGRARTYPFDEILPHAFGPADPNRPSPRSVADTAAGTAAGTAAAIDPTSEA